MAIMIAIPDMAAGAKQGWGVFFATMTAVLPAWLVQLLYFFILITQFLCGEGAQEKAKKQRERGEGRGEGRQQENEEEGR